MVDVVVHADWSVRPQGRWAATARRDGPRWRVAAPVPVGDLDAFRDGLLATARLVPVLAGFDFPIGVPEAVGVQTGFRGFREALPAFGKAAGWEAFYDLARTPAEISPRRPFYPAGSGGGTTRASLIAGLNLDSAAQLTRVCERGGAGRKRASPLFWTVGAAQVGRAAITGWRHVLVPAIEAGAALWPFDGTLAELGATPQLVLAETYPADSYGALGAPFRPGGSKRRQADRAGKAEAVLRWAGACRVDLSACEAVLRDGFGPKPGGEDPFDALFGLLAMLPIVDRPEAAQTASLSDRAARWEGWIFAR